jgi:hypothetical protein
MPTGKGTHPDTIRLQQRFQEVNGAVSQAGAEVTINQASLTGDQLRFTVARGDQGEMHFEGRVNGDAIHGRVEVRGGPAAGHHDWSAQRVSTSAATTPGR